MKILFSFTLPYSHFLNDDEIVIEDKPITMEYKICMLPPPPPVWNDPDDYDIVDTWYWVKPKPEPMHRSLMCMIRYIQKNFPKVARIFRFNGEVIIKFTCSKKGIPERIRVFSEEPEGLGFGETALNAVKLLRFKPIKYHRRPVKAEMVQKIKFRIKQKG